VQRRAAFVCLWLSFRSHGNERPGGSASRDVDPRSGFGGEQVHRGVGRTENGQRPQKGIGYHNCGYASRPAEAQQAPQRAKAAAGHGAVGRAGRQGGGCARASGSFLDRSARIVRPLYSSQLAGLEVSPPSDAEVATCARQQ
ncbi:unnamed protein product, partial [Effrenium voratum]